MWCKDCGFFQGFDGPRIIKGATYYVACGVVHEPDKEVCQFCGSEELSEELPMDEEDEAA